MHASVSEVVEPFASVLMVTQEIRLSGAMLTLARRTHVDPMQIVNQMETEQSANVEEVTRVIPL